MELNKKLLFKRLIALYIDLGITTMFSMLIYILIFQNVGVDEYSFVMFFTQILMICRDVFGRSIGKRCASLYIVNYERNQMVKLHQRLLRNVTGPIIIIEVFTILLREDHRRLGDLLANTDVSFQSK